FPDTVDQAYITAAAEATYLVRDLILPKASNNFYQNFADIVEAFYPLVSNSSGFILNCFSGLKIGLRRLWNLTDPANFLGLVVFHKNRRAK
ncbi:MAG: hypothetical protein AAFP03_01135, partial [Cyanobacteria bacterium J06598_3]